MHPIGVHKDYKFLTDEVPLQKLGGKAHGFNRGMKAKKFIFFVSLCIFILTLYTDVAIIKA